MSEQTQQRPTCNNVHCRSQIADRHCDSPTCTWTNCVACGTTADLNFHTKPYPEKRKQ